MVGKSLVLFFVNSSVCKASNKKTPFEFGIKGTGGSADLKISKSALLSLNHLNFSNTEPIYTK